MINLKTIPFIVFEENSFDYYCYYNYFHFKETILDHLEIKHYFYVFSL